MIFQRGSLWVRGTTRGLLPWITPNQNHSGVHGLIEPILGPCVPSRCFIGSLVRCLFTTFAHPRAPAAVNYRLHTLLLHPHFNPTQRRRWRYCYQSEDTEHIIVCAFPCCSDTFCSRRSLSFPQLWANAPSRVWAHSWRFRGSVRPHALQTKVHFNSPITRRFNPAVKERASCVPWQTSAHGVIAASKESGNKTTRKMGKNYKTASSPKQSLTMQLPEDSRHGMILGKGGIL